MHTLTLDFDRASKTWTFEWAFADGSREHGRVADNVTDAAKAGDKVGSARVAKWVGKLTERWKLDAAAVRVVLPPAVEMQPIVDA